MMREPVNPQHPLIFGAELAKNIGVKHIRVLRDRKAATPNAAMSALKTQVFNLAVDEGHVPVNPLRLVGRLETPKGGQEVVSDTQIAKYYLQHSSGAPWLAMRMLTEFGMRVSDLRIMGRQNVKGSVLVFDTVKTGVRCELAITPEMMADLPDNGPELTFLLSENDKPFCSDKSLSQRIVKWFHQAGIESVSAHGVRKWLATKMAENGATEMELMAQFGWRDAKEARPYVTKANRRKLAAQAKAKIIGVLRLNDVPHAFV